MERTPRKRRIAGASEQVAEELQRSIVARALVPGDRLGTEEELARAYGVSRPTLREAVRLLASVNLVRATKGPGGGVFLARTPEQGMSVTVSDAIARMLETDATSISELLEARTMLEAPLAGLAASRASEETIERLRASVREAEEHPGDDDVLRETNERFHRTIVDAAGNQVARAITEWAFDVLQPRLTDVVAPAIVEAVAVDQHRRILRAIERGEPAAAERAMREHLLYLSDLVETMASLAVESASPDESAPGARDSSGPR